MKMNSGKFFVANILLLFMVVGPAFCEAPDSGIYVRDGFTLSIAVSGFEAPRFMELNPNGVLYVSRPDEGQIKACRDTDGDGVYETITTFVNGYETAHAMQWYDGSLWFSVTGSIMNASDTDGDNVADNIEEVVGGRNIPKGGGHWWRSLLIHKGRIYTSIGDSGNINDERKTKRQKIWSYKIDGTDEQLFCSGLRNTEKLVVRPGTDEIWGMDHGSDWFGGKIEKEGRTNYGQPITDLNPPGEMNHYKRGGFYGHPFLVGNRVPRHEFLKHKDLLKLASETTPPEWCTGGHWAPNAMEFYTGDQFPDAKGDAFVAFHGSWNSSVPVGYCVSRVLFEQGRPYGELAYARFVDKSGRILGRPVDVVMEPDGSLLISDDDGGRIYRLRYAGK